MKSFRDITLNPRLRQVRQTTISDNSPIGFSFQNFLIRNLAKPAGEAVELGAQQRDLSRPAGRRFWGNPKPSPFALVAVLKLLAYHGNVFTTET